MSMYVVVVSGGNVLTVYRKYQSFESSFLVFYNSFWGGRKGKRQTTESLFGLLVRRRQEGRRTSGLRFRFDSKTKGRWGGSGDR